MDRNIWTGIMVLVFVVGIANAGRHLTIKEEQGGDIPLPLPKGEVTSSEILPQTANPTQVPTPVEDENVSEEKEVTFYMHHSIGVVTPGISSIGSGINGFGSGNGGGPLPLTFPIGALLNNPNNLVNGLGLGLGVGGGGGGSLINGANGIGVGGVGGLGGGVLSNPNFINNANSLGGLAGVGLLPTTTLNLGGLGLGQLGGANGGVTGVGGQDYNHMVMLEEPITHEPEKGSHPIGKAQGYYMEIESSHEHEHEREQDRSMLAMSFTTSFHDGEYSGSSVQLAGQIDMDDKDTKENESENVLQVVGGSGVFEKAKGHHALVHTIPSLHQEHGLLFKISIPLSP